MIIACKLVKLVLKVSSTLVTDPAQPNRVVQGVAWLVATGIVQKEKSLLSQLYHPPIITLSRCKTYWVQKALVLGTDRPSKNTLKKTSQLNLRMRTKKSVIIKIYLNILFKYFLHPSWETNLFAIEFLGAIAIGRHNKRRAIICQEWNSDEH